MSPLTSIFSCPPELTSFIQAIIDRKVAVSGTADDGYTIHHGSVTQFHLGFNHISQGNVFISSTTPSKIEKDFYITEGCAIPLSAQKIKQAIDCSFKKMT